MQNENINYDESGSTLTGKQWNVLAASLKCVYGNQNFLADEFAMKLWYQMLRDIPYDTLVIAVQKYMQTQHFPPTPADIRKLASEVARPVVADWSSGWEEVLKAIRFFGFYRQEEALASMSDITRECVKRIGWNEICMSENVAADRANFRQIYTAIAERKKTDSVLSQNLLQKIEQKKAELIGIEVKDGRSN